MARHVNVDAGDDEGEAAEPAQGAEGHGEQREPARHVAPSAHPDALVEHGLGGDGHELPENSAFHP